MKRKKNESSDVNKSSSQRSKGFYFEDYKTSNYKEYSKYSSAKLSLQRVSFVFFIFLVLAFIFGTKIIYLASIKKENYFTNHTTIESLKKRQDILDRNNILLAKNIKSYSAAIRPSLIKNKEKLLIKLTLNFPSLDISEIKKKIEIGKFFYLKKRLKPNERQNFLNLGEKSIDVSEEKEVRIYPQESLFSHVLGQIDDDNSGISGLEKSQNKKLIESTDSLILTLDTNLQYLIRQELISAGELFQTVGSAALLMKIDSGEILSLVSLPDYDLNERINIENPRYLNKITKGVYELGSVFKTFTLAAALENKVINVNTMFNNLESELTCAGMSISEHDKLPKNLSAEQILIRSSNIGAIRIAQKLGIEKYKKFLNSLELFQKIDFELEEIGTPLSFIWGKCKLATASFGHGVTTTPLQLARAYAILGNGGYLIKPTVLLKKDNNVNQRERIISSETSDAINSILRKVVFNKEGTANFANVKGYDIAGKTGTALKSVNGKYTKKKLNTFVSLFPSSDPKYVLLVILDEPKSAPDFTYEFPSGYKHKGEKRNTSGWNTVVVAGKIIEKIGPILAINNLQAYAKF